MVILDRDELVFVHIPKSAGTFIRKNLGDSNEFWGHKILENIGIRNFAHLTLAEIEEFLPDVWNKLKRYDSFAVTRDPYSRFSSSILEHIKIYHTVPDHYITNRYVRTVGKEISRLLPSSDFKLAHFTRQVDFIYLHGYRIVKNVYSLENIEDCVREIEKRLGREFDRRPHNIARRGIPLWAKGPWNFIKSQYPQVGNLDIIAKIRAINNGRRISLGRYLENFVRSYYKDDIELHQMANSGRLSPLEHGHPSQLPGDLSQLSTA